MGVPEVRGGYTARRGDFEPRHAGRVDAEAEARASMSRDALRTRLANWGYLRGGRR